MTVMAASAPRLDALVWGLGALAAVALLALAAVLALRHPALRRRLALRDGVPA